MWGALHDMKFNFKVLSPQDEINPFNISKFHLHNEAFWHQLGVKWRGRLNLCWTANFISGNTDRRTPKFDGGIMQLHEACNFHCHVWLTCEGSLSRYGKFQHNLGKWRIFAGCMENIVSKIFGNIYRRSIYTEKFLKTSMKLFFCYYFSLPQHPDGDHLQHFSRNIFSLFASTVNQSLIPFSWYSFNSSN